MKTKNLGLLLAVTATVALTQIPLDAAAPLLSPRAKANQIKTVPGITENRLVRSFTVPPKAQSLRIKTVPGVTEDRLDRSIKTVSPRALVTFPWLAKPAAPKSSSHAGKLHPCCPPVNFFPAADNFLP
jgi:hypothetical protein